MERMIELQNAVIYPSGIYHGILHEGRCPEMTIGKVFMTGRSQAVRIPKEYRFAEDEVIINKIGDVLLIMPKSKAKDVFLKGVESFTDDFMSDGRNQPQQQEREFFE